MSLQFRKRIKVLPGLSLNIGKRGISLSSGIRGARVTVAKDRVTSSAGIPGTGMYVRKSTAASRDAHRNAANADAPYTPNAARGAVYLAIIAAIIIAAIVKFLL